QTVIACDRGRIQIENGRVRVSELRQSIREATAMDPRLWGDLPGETRDVTSGLINSFEELLGAFYGNFVQAVNGEAVLVCAGAEARNAVELANAFVLSSAANEPVALPLDRAAYDAFIEKKLETALVQRV